MRLPDSPRIRRELRYMLWAWTIIASAGATIGGIIGIIEIAREPR